MQRHIPRWLYALLWSVLSLLFASCAQASVHQMLISPLATAARQAETPIPSVTNSASFLRVEATYNAAASAGIFPTLIIATETPTPPIAAVTENDRQPGKQVLRIQKPSPDFPDIYLTVSTAEWILHATTLNHHDLSGCQLELNEAARGVIGPVHKSVEGIGNVQWDVTDVPSEALITFYTPHFLFGMHYTADHTDPAFAQCRDAVEEVIATFRPTQ